MNPRLLPPEAGAPAHLPPRLSLAHRLVLICLVALPAAAGLALTALMWAHR